MNRITIANKQFEIFLDKDMIQKRIRLLGVQLNVDYEGKRPLIVGVLNGSFLFMADLVKELNINCEIAFMRLQSYEGTKTTGKIKELIGLPENIKGRDIIIVEDIVDTGLTISHILKTIREQQPSSVTVCSLLLKPMALKHEVPELGYVGFEIPDDFVVGYGLDYDGLGRNSNDIYKAV
ncbi:hypoxanthine phosphoribosyltransferase [Pedobacter sp. UYP30]|uniref:hypoxanthine phosphoribosyltransferase n=1 Tax=Pedobacter sp. UYP30 TaxID=1756400 RepID=UPI0033943A99